ncbi:O-antigen ligase [Rhizobium aethiopicum]|uniref:O-antigen ligase n=1 Tax=Rhizobium aethiopicum TaxID=1138170 RepID=A0A7W6QD36_9HYPH|nr:O-antigen ligase family protein [Rhizobium aethiopicum]MBB4195294.1 O-antigen ligase [Rhizobium aethiopicum]MBB4584024.1 O-antigen ligase [Rhizobium aethiopicum]
MTLGRNIVPLLLFAIAVCLNFDFVLQVVAGKSPALNLWALIPVFMALFYLPSNLIRCDTSSITYVIFLFSLILVANGVRNTLAVGPTGFVWALLSYGLWLGLFLWTQKQSPRFLFKVIVKLFLFSALLHASVALYELLSGQALLKVVTIGTSVERRYGISFSLGVLGLQLGCGALAALGAMRLYRSTTPKILVVLCFYLIAMALYATAIRAPLLYLVLAALAIVVSRYFSSVPNIMNVMFVGALIVVSAIILDRLGEVNLNFVGSAFELSDSGNMGRLDRYSASIGLLMENWWAPIFGYGPAMLTQVPVSFGLDDFGTESSALKTVLELGAIGVLPLATHMSVLFMRLCGPGGLTIIKANIEAFAIMAFITLECLTSEIFKSWIGSFYFVLVLGLITRLTLFPQKADVEDQ